MYAPGTRLALTLAGLTLACSAAAQQSAARAPSSPVGQGGDWQVLFDGHSTSAWRGFHMDTMPIGWQIVDGALTRVGRGGDIVTRDQFADFELQLDWKIAKCGNSGVMYRVTDEPEQTYYSGPEMQVLDDSCHPDGKSPLTSAGADYALYPAKPGVVKPAGEWNHVRIVVQGAHVEHWLNGTKVVEYELWSPDWNGRVKNSKFVEWPEYGQAKRGHIALQDHGDRVAYRDIKIRVLP